MERRVFVDKLELIAPALSKSDMIPVMCHFWFTGDTLMAYNDTISISLPFKSEFVGAVPGDTLLKALRASKAREIEFQPNEKELHVKAASSRLKFALLPEDMFLFDMPDSKGDKTRLDVKFSDFVHQIGLCLPSVGHDTAIPDQAGITLIDEGEYVGLYATNDHTISHSRVKIRSKTPFKDRVILNGEFCERMVSFCKDAKILNDASLEITDEHALFVAGDLRLFGRLIESPSPVDFVKVLDHHVPEKARKNLVPIPTKMKLILERATIITDGAIDDIHTSITVKESGIMRFHSKSERGEIRDSVQIGEKHPMTQCRVQPKLLKPGYGVYENMLVSEDCVVLERDGAIFMVAAGH